MMGRSTKMYSTRSKKAQAASKGKKNIKTPVVKFENNSNSEPDLSAIVYETKNYSDDEEDDEEEVMFAGHGVQETVYEENDDVDEDAEEEEFEEESDHYEYSDVDDDEESEEEEDVVVESYGRNGNRKVDTMKTGLSDSANSGKAMSSKKKSSRGTSKAVKKPTTVTNVNATTGSQGQLLPLTSTSNATDARIDNGEGRNMSNGIGSNGNRDSRTVSQSSASAGTSNSTGRNSTAIRDLSSFGITAAPGLNVEVSNVPSRSKLRMVVINGLNGHKDIVFRCEPTFEGSNVSSWCEKVLADAIRTKGSWTSSFNISTYTFNWYENNKLQLNANGYPIRLFHMAVVGETGQDEFLDMWSYVCELITNTPRNTERMFLDRNDLYWLEGPTVWSDVIGVSKALTMIRHHRGSTYQGFYEANRDFVLTYFKEEDVANISQLYAPLQV